MKNWFLVLALFGAASFTRALGATSNTYTPDNSAVNQQDRAAQTATADSQMKSSKRDTEITRMIRKELTKDDSLSTYAKNVKVITHDGEVILRGPVRSEREENKIVATAKEVAGDEAVRNQLEVKTNP